MANKNNYFNEVTENDVRRYIESEDNAEKAYYFSLIYSPINRLIEGVYQTMFRDGDDVKRLTMCTDCFTYTFEKTIHQINFENGRAYSYLTKSALNYFNRQAFVISRHTKRYGFEIDEIQAESKSHDRYVDTTELSDVEATIKRFVAWYHPKLQEMYEGDELRIADAIMTLFKNAQYIEIFNKKSLYIQIREMSKSKTSEITPVVRKIRGDYLNFIEWN
jgi:hypothetical protein